MKINPLHCTSPLCPNSRGQRNLKNYECSVYISGRVNALNFNALINLKGLSAENGAEFQTS